MAPGPVTVNVAGTVEVVTYKNSERGWAVLKLKPDDARYVDYCDKSHRIPIVGSLSEIGIGQRLSVTGTVIHNPKWGTQIKVEGMVLLNPRP